MTRFVIPLREPCRPWSGALDRDGYGVAHVGRRSARAHRVAYVAALGPIPDGLELDHVCRNRACCEPTHLEPVTTHENLMRGDGLAAQNARKTHCINGHEFTPENTATIYQGGRRRPNRACRKCRQIRKAEYRARRRRALITNESE